MTDDRFGDGFPCSFSEFHESVKATQQKHYAMGVRDGMLKGLDDFITLVTGGDVRGTLPGAGYQGDLPADFCAWLTRIRFGIEQELKRDE